MTTLQVSLSLSSCNVPVFLGSNLKTPSKSVLSLPHFSNFNHLPSSRLSGIPTYKFASVSKPRIAPSRISCSAITGELESSEIVKERSVSVILLAGGKGKRMGASMPKQYLPLLGQPIALYRLQ